LAVALRELGQWTGGGTTSKFEPSFWRGGSIPWVSPKDMKVPRIRQTEDSITERALEESPAKLIPAGSVLVVTRSGILAHSLPVAVTEVPVTVNQDLKAFIPTGVATPEYVAAALRSAAQQILATCSKDGTTVQSVDTSKLLAHKILVAPIPEQRRIVDAIDSYLSRLDEAEAALERVRRNLKRYRAAVLQAAVEGRLVPTEAELARAEGRDYEPASQLLKSILADRQRRWEQAEYARLKAAGKTPRDEQWKAKYREPTRLEMAALPSLPEGWCWVAMSALCAIEPQNGIYLPKTDYGDGMPILRIDDYQIDRSRGAEEFQRVRIPATDAAKYALHDGDLVINRVNSPSHLGKALVVGSKHLPAIFESNMMRIQLTESLVPAFVEKYLNSTGGKARLTKNAKWAVNQASINQRDVVSTPVPLPPLVEQGRIVAEVERLFSLSESTLAAVTQAGLHTSRLRQSTLKWAFEGKLVDQDPNDEPASVVLERIQAERAMQDLTPIGASRGRNRRER